METKCPTSSQSYCFSFLRSSWLASLADRVKGQPRRPYRPTRVDYNASQAERILERVSEGETLTEVCRDPLMGVSIGVFRRWCREREDLRDKWILAKFQQAEAWSDKLIEIADDTSGDFKERGDGSTYVDHENIQRSKLRIETRKWLMGKNMPKLYGEHQEINQNVGGNVKVVIERGLTQGRGGLKGAVSARIVDITPPKKIGPAKLPTLEEDFED